jgi:ABC-2 type transport system permease protein/sodium transport system permease protein
MLCLALLFPALFLVNNILAQAQAARAISERQFVFLFCGAAQLALFAGLPLTAARIARVRLSSGLGLRGAPFEGYIGATLLGLSLWPFAFEIIIAARDLGIVTIAPERFQEVQEVMASVKTASPIWFVLTYGFLPAVSEELFFRGYLFGALRARMNATATILASAGIFGAFHLIATDSLAVERLLPTTAIGVVLGWVRWKTRSILPGMLLHALHNSFLLLVAYYEQELSELGIGRIQEDHLPWTWLAGAAAVAGLGAALILVGSLRDAAKT